MTKDKHAIALAFTYSRTQELIEKVRADEREACARICDEAAAQFAQSMDMSGVRSPFDIAGRRICECLATTIRAGKK